MLNAKQYLIGLVYAETQTYLSEIDVVFSDPVRLEHGSSRNTHVKVYPKVWVPFINGYDLYYNRVHSSRVRPFKIIKGDAKTVHQVIDIINDTQEFNFTVDDLVDNALPIADSEGYVIFKPEFKPTSLGFYSGEIVKTITEYIDPTQPLPPDPVNPDDIPPPPYPMPPAETLLRTECRLGELWGYYTVDNASPQWRLLSATDPLCTEVTLTPVNARVAAEAGESVIVTYFLNKPLTETLNLRVKVIDAASVATPVGAIQYKGQNDSIWALVSTSTGFTVPAGTTYFSLTVGLRPETDANLFVRLVEKGGDNKLSNGNGIDVQLDVTGVSVPNPTPFLEFGTLISEFCNNQSTWGKYADGVGGQYDKVITPNDPDCGYIVKPALTVDYPAISILEGQDAILSYSLDAETLTPLGLNVGIEHLTTIPEDITSIEYQLEGENDWTVLPSNGNITIPAGNLFFSIRLTIAEDALVEGNEYLKVKVVETASVPKLRTAAVTTNTTIIDIDTPTGTPTAILSEPPGLIYASETAPTVVRFTLSEAVPQNVPMLFKILYGNATPDDVVSFECRTGSGAFVPISHNGTFVIYAGDLFIDVRVTAATDLTTEGTETFIISLEETTINTYLANEDPVMKVVNILDNSTTPAPVKPTLSVSNGTLNVDEGSIGTVVFNLSAPATSTIALMLTGSFITADPSDINTIQYVSGSGGSWITTTLDSQINLNNGDSSISVRFTANADTIAETDETFTLTLTEPVIGTKLSNTAGVSKSITIKNLAMVDIPPYETGGDPHWDKVILYIPGVGSVNGAITDVSSYGRTIVKKTSEVEKVYLDGDGITFNGNGLLVTDSSNLALAQAAEPFTIEFDMIRPEGPYYYGVLGSYSNGTGGSTFFNWNLAVEGGSMNGAVFFSSGASNTSNRGSFDNSSWNRIEFAFDGTYYRQYVNGVQVHFAGIATIPNNPVGALLTIGISFVDGAGFKGKMRNIRITKGVCRHTSNYTVDLSKLYPIGPV